MARIAESAIERLKQEFSLVRLVEARGIELKRHGADFIGLCPFHDEAATAHERGWDQLKNGELLDAAEKNGFTVLVTTDTNLRYQQTLASRTLAIVVLRTTSWARIQTVVESIVAAVDAPMSGSYVEIDIP